MATAEQSQFIEKTCNQTFDWPAHFAARSCQLRHSAIREMLKLTQASDFISFGGGMPAPEMFPIREFRDACVTVLEAQGAQALQYGPTEGYRPLREQIAADMRRFGLEISADNVLLTSGSQQALDLIGKMFVEAGRPICIERPTYVGALQAWSSYHADYKLLQLDQDGAILDDIAAMLRARKTGFIYLLPNFQNPAGVSMSCERRRRLVEIVRRENVFILEDDPYHELRFEGEEISPIIQMAPERTIYLSTFSKTLSPGIRLGWVVAPKAVIDKLNIAKQGMDLHTSTFIQMVAHAVIRGGILPRHIDRIRAAYRERRDAMLEAMKRFFPEEICWTRPRGGLFLWVTTPPWIDTVNLLKAALDKKVAYVPGDSFFPEGSGLGRHNMRLNFSFSRPEIIVEGIRRLGEVFKAARRLS